MSSRSTRSGIWTNTPADNNCNARMNREGRNRQRLRSERSPEKAGVGGSIPPLATTLSSLKSALADLFFRLCQICAVDHPDYQILTGVIFGGPLRIVPADRGGAIPRDVSRILGFVKRPGPVLNVSAQVYIRTGWFPPFSDGTVDPRSCAV